MSGAGNMGNTEDTGNTTGIRPIHGKGSGTHFSDEELLAYLHKDIQGNTLRKVQQQHISNCSICRTRLEELEQSEQLFILAVQASRDDYYASITEPIMSKVNGTEPVVAQHWSGTRGQGRLKLASLALVIAALVIITFGSLLLSKLPASPVLGHRSVSPSPTVKTKGITVPSHVNPTPTMVPTVAGTKVVQLSGSIWNCTLGSDQQRQHLLICGSNFVAGDNLVLTLVNFNGKLIKKVGPIQVMVDGTFVQNIPVHSCRDVPWTIYTQDISSKVTEAALPLSGISYRKC